MKFRRSTNSGFLGWKRSLISVAVAALFLGMGEAQEINIRLTNGANVSVRIESIDSESLSFRAAASNATARLGYDQIDTVEWPEPQEWVTASQWFSRGKYAEAIPIYEKIAESKDKRLTFYPAPGNFATQAHRRLLDCYRRLGDAKAVATHLAAFEPKKMPAAEREMPPILPVWAAAGVEDWQKVLTLAEGVSQSLSAASEQGIELAYLKGLALEKNGQIRDALVSYAQAYALNAATDSRLSRRALERSIALVAADAEQREANRDERREEEDDLNQLRSQVHLYASLFGKGSLWEQAGTLAHSALAGPLDLGEAALGQTGRTKTEGEMTEESEGVKMIEQVTADHMKKVEAKGAEKESEPKK